MSIMQRKEQSQNLLSALYRRFVFAFVLLGFAMLSVSFFRSGFTQQQYASKERLALLERSQQRFDQQREAWLIDAKRTVNELEFIRIDQLSITAKQAKMTAFFAAQGENRAFESIVITDSLHVPIYELGCDNLKEAMTITEETLALIYCDGQPPAIYHIIELPIWLGEQGTGYAHFAKQVTPAVLTSIGHTNGFALIRYADTPITSSDGDAQLNEAQQQVIDHRIKTQPATAFDLTWPEYPQVTINLLKALPPADPWWMIVLPPLLVIALSLGVIWLLLGRWMQQLSTRLNLLWSGVQSYAISQDITKALPYLKSFENREQQDDVARLGRALLRMMNDVDAAREQEIIFTETLALLEEAVITIDANNNLLETSAGWQRLIRLATPTGERFLGYIHPDDREGWLLKSAQLLENEKEIIHVRFRLNSNQAASPWLEGRFLAHHNEAGVVTIRGALRDVTQSYLQEQQITHMALHDALTGLANRILLEDRLKQSLLLCERNQQQLAVLFFDLDHFKQVNDALGHKAGDQLLIAISQRISACLRASDTLARWGGDEFVILLPNIDNIDDARTLANHLMQSMQTPISIDGNELPASFSIGAAIYPQDALDVQSLFSNADRAMFYAKNQGRNQAAFFADMNHKDNGKQELYIQNRLANAIKTQQLEVYYQPIIDCKTGKVYAVEALTRWHDERYGWVPPVTFIPMAENLGLICQLGEIVLSQSFHTLQSWSAAGLDLVMAVNVSSRQLFSPSFIHGLSSELAKYRLSPDRIVLEVTESLALRDVDHAMTRLQELQKLGFHVAIDDFGTGHSSLAQLQEINADELKIDRAFIMRIEEDKGHNMVKAVSDMAHALHLKTVAEGVETEQQKGLLCAMGVNYLQGYYFAKPMPEHECLVWMTAFNRQGDQ